MTAKPLLLALLLLFESVAASDPLPGFTPTRPTSPTLESRAHAAALQAPNVTNPNGGPVIANVKIAMILYDNAVFNPQVDGRASPSMPHFYQDVVNDCTMGWLSEYSTPTQTIGSGSFLGMNRLTPSPSRDGSTITDQNVRDELAHQIDIQTVPSPDNNTLYMIHLRPGQIVTYPNHASCGNICAYHSSFTHNGHSIYYAVLPDIFGCSVCGGGDFGDQTMNAFHEIVEAITDPVVGSGWTDKANTTPDEVSEIADDCAWDQHDFIGHDGLKYTLQSAWSQSRQSCYWAPTPVTLGSPTNGHGCVAPSGTLTWSAVAGATSYWVQIATSPSFTSGIVEDATTSTPSDTYGPLATSTTYYWWVRAIVPSGCVRAASAVQSFTTATPPPGVPTVLSPADGSTGLPTTGTLDWSDAPRATNYLVTLRCSTGAIYKTFTTTASQFAYALSPEHYSWTVESIDACAQHSAPSPSMSFTVGTGVACAVALPQSPADGDSCIGASGTLQWQPIPGAVGYVVQLTDQLNKCLTNKGSEVFVTTNTYDYSGLNFNHTYNWRVKEDCPCAAYSDCMAFTTAPDSQKTQVPKLSSPTNLSTNLPASGTLLWQAVPNASTYVVQLGTACGSGPESTVATPNCPYSGLQQNASYFWRIRAVDACGHSGAYSNCWSFRTQQLTGLDRFYIPAGLSFAQGDTLVRIPIRAENLAAMREFQFTVTLDPRVFAYRGWSVVGTRADGAATVTVQFNQGDGSLRVQHVILPPGNQCPPSVPPGDGEVFEILARVLPTAATGPVTVPFSGPQSRFVDCSNHTTQPTNFSNSIQIVPPITSVDNQDLRIPSSPTITNAAPNPTNSGTSLRFGLPSAQWVRLIVCDVAGREITTIVDGAESAGWHTVQWNGSDSKGQRVPPGVYLIRLSGDTRAPARTVIVVR